MDEQNKQPEQNKPEKKLSRTTLTFYIVGLFSVAIALILISYVAQSRADKQVENLSSQLSQQQTVAQGATQKVEDLQKQYDEQQQAIEGVRTALSADKTLTADEQKDIAAGTGKLVSRASALSKLAAVQNALLAENYEQANTLYQDLVNTFTEPALDRTGSDETLWVLTAEEAEQFKQVKQKIEAVNNKAEE